MALGTAMSAKTPYIGSKISLISKAEIRYEGVLYAVDTKEATVTLAKGSFSFWFVIKIDSCIPKCLQIAPL